MKKEKNEKITITFSRKTFIICGSALLLLVAGLVGALLLFNSEKITLIENLDIEINSETKFKDLISTANSDIEIINIEESVDSSKLGQQEVKILYKTKSGKEKEFIFKVNIKDTTPPVIEYKKEIVVYIGEKVDLLKSVTVTDNSLEEIEVKVEGEYDVKKEGKYSLKYITQDSSGNKTEEEFVLKVISVKVKTTGMYYHNFGDVGDCYTFNKNGKFDYGLCWAKYAQGGYGSNGTYKVSGNKITLTHTHAIDGSHQNQKLKKPVVETITLKNENTVEAKTKSGKTLSYKWRKNYPK